LETVKYGSRGDAVRRLQELLSVTADGIFGSKTEEALKAYQTENNLTADGICGSKTWGKLLGAEEPAFIQPVNYKQYDSRWASVMYSNHGDKKQTMKSSACGPTAMADIVATMVDSTVTPVTLAEKALAWGDRTYSSGTRWAFFKHIKAEYGFSRMLQTTSLDALKDCLATGGYAVVSFGKSKWTTSGHYCCIWKYDDKYFYINDPASSKASRAKGTYSEVKAARKTFFLFWR